jgi:hypothetical protein
MNEDCPLKLSCDSSPIVSFSKMLECALKVSKRALNLSDFPFELARVDVDRSSTNAGELMIRLYPSDAFLRFASTIFTGQFYFSAIEES